MTAKWREEDEVYWQAAGSVAGQFSLAAVQQRSCPLGSCRLIF